MTPLQVVKRKVSASLPLLNLSGDKAPWFPRGAGQYMVCGPGAGVVEYSSIRPTVTMSHSSPRHDAALGGGTWDSANSAHSDHAPSTTVLWVPLMQI